MRARVRGAPRIAAALRDASFESVARADVMRWKYAKLLKNLSNGVNALCSEPVPDVSRAVSAEAIHTDATGLEAGEVKVPVKDGTIPAYRAMPDKGGPFPTVLVIQEVFGVHEHIKDLCRRLAKLGYFAIAPELYARQGDPSKYTHIPTLISEVVNKVPTEQVMSDLDATEAYAKSTGKADTSKLAVTGFCWGGFATWMYAAHNPDLGSRSLVRRRPQDQRLSPEEPGRHRRPDQMSGTRLLRWPGPEHPAGDAREAGGCMQGGRQDLRSQGLSGRAARL